MEKRGLILVVGAAGSGKSTTIASMIDHRNELVTGHILTFEDPIEFLFRNKKSIINQREIGTDAKTLHDALRNAMRQAPDVHPDRRDPRPRDDAGGRVVLACPATWWSRRCTRNNCYHALNRVISFYTPETRKALFEDLAASLKAIISQRLVRSKKGGRVPTVEILMNAGHMRDLIERGDIAAIKEAMEQSLSPESQSFEQSLYELLQKDLITKDDALSAADSKNNLLYFINNAGRQKNKSDSGKSAPPPSSSFSEFTLNI